MAVALDPGVTVVQLGPQLILSVNVNGAQGQSFQASFTLDSDGDGMPDDVELAQGRNPNSAADLGFEFNTEGDFQGWGNFKNITNQVVSGGVLSGTSTTIDPYFSCNGFNFAGSDVSNIVVKIRLPSANTVQWYWGRVGATGFAGHTLSAAYTGSNTWQLLTFPLATNPDWQGQTITSLRLDPGTQAGQPFAVDWIRAMAGNPDGFSLSSGSFSNGAFSMAINGQANATYAVQASTNLVTWLPLWTNNQFSTPPFKFTDLTATNYPRRFYRALPGS